MMTNAMRRATGTIAGRLFSPFRCLLALALLVGAFAASAQTTTTAKTPAPFDHASTGFTLVGKHAVTPCGTCHYNAVFKGTPKQCKLCHVAGNRYNTIGMSAAHIPTAEDCDTCHKANNPWDVTVMKHTQSMNNRCSNCHEAGLAFRGLDNLMTRPTRLTHPQKSFSGAVECGVCHTSTSNFAVVVPGSGMPNGHIPTNRPCGDCHTANTSNYSGAIMSHAGISAGCISCHQAGVDSTVFVGVSVKGQGNNHLPTNAMACESCHSAAQAALYDASQTPGGFGSTMMNHNGLSTCSGCHQSTARQFFQGPQAYPKGQDGSGGIGATSGSGPHIPTQSECNTCHFSTSTNGFQGTRMNHAGITGGCSDCHESGSFLGLIRTASVFLDRAHAISAVNSHPDSTSGDCSGCHSSTTTWTTIFPPTGHIPVPNGVACSACHSSFSVGGEIMSHTGIAGTCQTCHGLGKSFSTVVSPPLVTQLSTHIGLSPTNCVSSGCHSASNFTSFGQTLFRHLDAAGAALTKNSDCASCHEAGKTFQGQGNMLPTATLVVRPPTPHPDASKGNCATSCHTLNYTSFQINPSGVSSASLPSGHFPMSGSKNCLACHTSTTDTFGSGSGVMNHVGISSGCSTCHGKTFVITRIASVGGTTTITPKAMASNHIPTTAACETCHSATNFSTFAGSPMKHTAITTGCQACHESTKVGVFQGAGSMTPSADVVVRPGAPHTTAAASPDCVPCHTSTTSFLTLSSTAGTAMLATMSPPHIPITVAGVALPCANCHVSNFLAGSGHMSHTSISSSCATCHGTGMAARYYGVTIVVKDTPTTHIPSTAACETCHSKTNFTSFSGTSMVHSGITSGCQSCHENGLAAFQGSGNMTPTATMVVRPINADHPTKATVADCVPCHTSTTTFKTLAATLPNTALPPNHLPNTGNQPCTTCHGAGGNFLPGIMVHTGIAASACATCHQSGGAWIGIGTVVTLKTFSNVPSPGHIPSSATCSNCHSATNFTTFAIAASKMNHSDATVLTKTCQSCHGVGTNTSYYLGGVTWVGQSSLHIPITATPNCNTCHTKTTVGGFAGTAMNHTGLTANCQTCHDVGGATASGYQGAANMTPTSPVVQRPTTAQDPSHPSKTVVAGQSTSGNADCVPCHTTTPPFAGSGGSMPSGHISTSQPCTLCHAAGYAPGLTKMVHTGIVSGCATCHDVNSTSTYTTLSTTSPALVTKLSSHVPTTSVTNGAVCETCHSASNFTTFRGTAMKHTGIAATCQTCHNNASAGSYQGSGYMTPTAAVVQRPTTAQDASHPTAASNPDCVPCHTTNPPFTGTGGTLPAGHMPTVQPCSACHSAGYSASLTKMSHTGIASGCASCHDVGKGSAYTGFATITSTKGSGIVTKLSTHVATTSVTGGTLCETCHSLSNFTTFSGTAMKHTGITTNCVSCHGNATGLSFQGVVPMYAFQPGTHIPLPGGAYGSWTAECSVCHSATTVGGFNTGTKLLHGHATVTPGQCNACHRTTVTIKPVGFEKITTESASHQGGGSCDGSKCHNTSSFSK
jgi:hypothetical protein